LPQASQLLGVAKGARFPLAGKNISNASLNLRAAAISNFLLDMLPFKLLFRDLDYWSDHPA
jgi:hypothetical protein